MYLNMVGKKVSIAQIIVVGHIFRKNLEVYKISVVIKLMFDVQ